ncbi:MAG: alpha/beta fold hydrolase [Rubrivivax sp.]|nr:alpha/beta fold hydrolase [Rubrivivax sp.]
MSQRPYPESFRNVVGDLPEAGRLPAEHLKPFETVEPVAEGFVERAGVRIGYAVWGTSGPWLAFPQPFQIAHMRLWRTVVPYLSRYFRVVTCDGRGNGRSDRPHGQAAYSLDEFHADFVAVLDAVDAHKVALVAISAASLISLRLAAEQPERITHLIVAGGMAEIRMDDPQRAQMIEADIELMRADWPGYLDAFMGSVVTEPHSTKGFEDGVRHAWATDAQTLEWCRRAWLGSDVTGHARLVRCPTLVIHGDDDRRVPYARGKAVHELIPGAKLLTIGGGGHIPSARDPAFFNRTVREFVLGAPPERTWVRAVGRKKKALFISSPIGLGHVQRDLAIARELRKQHGDLEIDWFTVDPAARYLEREGERLHPATKKLANESRHFEGVAGEHDLHAFFAMRTMDEVMTTNFMTFADLMDAEHYDIVVGDEAWDVDHYYHENPELKRQPFVFLTDFVGCLPMNKEDEREAHLCADRNAESLEQVGRYPHVRDMSLFVGNREDVVEEPFGPGLPGIREWTDRNFCYCGYCLPFDPAALADTDRLRARHGYLPHEKVAIASVGGTAVGRHLLKRIAEAFPRMKTQVPELRLVLVTGPRLPTDDFAEQPGLQVRPYLHNLYEHLACCDLALVQGGLSTCMELVATRRPFLSFPLRNHFEQCIHVRRRLFNYGADNSVDYHETSPDELAERALAAMHRSVRYRPVETDGAARAAARIAQVLENRWWAK